MILGEVKERDYNKMAWEVFVKAVDIAGGPWELAKARNLTWLPSLAEAAYTWVMVREGGKLEEDVAKTLGITKQTVKNILRASGHKAGELAKEGYERWKADGESLKTGRWVCERYWKIFEKAIELLGGLHKVIEYRNLTWLPSLMAASIAIAMAEEGRDEEEIAEALGYTKETVRQILKADPEPIKEGNLGEVKEHKAGALAKWAFEELKKEGAI